MQDISLLMRSEWLKRA